MSKKILHIISDLSFGGITTYVVRLAKALPNYQHIIISCFDGNAKDEISKLDISLKVLMRRSVSERRVLWKKYISFLTQYRKLNPDIIHYHSGGIGILLLSIILRGKSKVIHQFHSASLIVNNFSQDVSSLHILLLKILSDRTIKICVADHIRDEYKKRVSESSNLELVVNSVPYAFSKRKLSKNTIGYIGRFEEIKGFSSFLYILNHITKQIPNLEFIAMGHNYEKSKTPLKILKASFNITTFFENVDLIFFLSTATEGLPLVVLEAISFDVGVIAYPIKGVVEILGDDYPLYINNPIDAISKIENFYSAKFDRKHLSNVHQERSNKFLFDDMIGKINSLYNSLLIKN